MFASIDTKISGKCRRKICMSSSRSCVMLEARLDEGAVLGHPSKGRKAGLSHGDVSFNKLSAIHRRSPFFNFH